MLINGLILFPAAIAASSAGESLCHREYVSTQGLFEALRNDQNVENYGTTEDYHTYYDRKNHILWWTYNTEDGNFIITCKMRKDKRKINQNYIVNSDCGDDQSGQCAIQIRKMAKAKF
jgi:hypothetical protein